VSVAVLGCGADVDYPAASRALLAHLRVHGAVVSELPWGMEPRRNAFAARNRIIAGLAGAVLVVEAGLPSGTFSTAEQAIKADREVWAVPGSIFAPECRGANRLIAQGAMPVTDVSDLALGVGRLGLVPTGLHHVPEIVAEHRDAIMRALVADPMRPDDLARELLMDVVEVMRRIAGLEVEGKVVRQRDGRYAPTPKKELRQRGGERPG
jgi:DNA processing protein